MKKKTKSPPTQITIKNVSSLSDKEIDLLIAQRLGQVACKWDGPRPSPFHATKGNCKHKNCYPEQFGPPKYSTNLDLIHEAERTHLTTVESQVRYIFALKAISWDANFTKADGWAVFATARQKAEAFLVATEKLEDLTKSSSKN